MFLILTKSKRKWVYYLFGILLLAFFFRFINLYHWFPFGMDQEYEALVVKNILTFRHFPLIGVNASDTGLYLGPFFLYFATIPYAIFSGNPIGWGITASFVGFVTCYAIFVVGKRMFRTRVGLIGSFFYAISFLASFYDRQFWNPMFVSLLSLGIGYILYKILQGHDRFLTYLALLVGIIFHVHLSLLIFSPIILFILIKKRRIFKKQTIYYSVILFLLLLMPLIIFDLRHNFTNTTAAINLLQGCDISSTSSTLNQRIQLFISTVGRFFWLPVAPDLSLESGQCRELSNLRREAYPEGIIMMGIGLFIVTAKFIRQRRKGIKGVVKMPYEVSSKLLFGIIGSTMLFIIFYNRQIFEYYFLYLFPWLAIMLGVATDVMLRWIDGKYFVIPILISSLLLNILTLYTASMSFSFPEKMSAVIFASKYLKGSDYALEAVGECPRYGGYGYLFEQYLHPPIKYYMDSYFSWLYHEKNKEQNSTRVVLLSLIDYRNSPDHVSQWNKEKLLILSDYTIIAQKQFGKIVVYILDPKEKI